MVCDPSGACDTVLVPITVTPVNDPPVVVETPSTTPEDVPVTFCPPISDIDDATATLTTSICGTGSNGNMVAGPGANCFTYTPNTNFNGLDTVCTIVCDPSGLCDTAYHIITVTPVNDTPTIAQPPVVLPEDSLIKICPTIADIDNAMTNLTITICDAPDYGTMTAVVGEPHCFVYTPNTNYNGPDSVCFTVCDEDGACSSVIVPITVIPVNDPPVAIDNAVTTPEDVDVNIPVLNNDTDVDSTLNPGSVAVVTPPSNGIVTIDPLTGIATYDPDTNFVGVDTFTYVVCDNGTPLPVLCDTAQVIVTITAVNDAPIAVNDTTSTLEDVNVTIQVVTTNDSDVDGLLNTNIDLNLGIGGVQNTITTANGVYTNDGNGNVTFDPNPNFNGIDSTPYIVCDQGTPMPAMCDTAMIYVNVVPVNDAPVAVNDAATTPEDVNIAVNVLGNDTDSDSTLNPGSVAIVDGPSNGMVTINPLTGVITYDPDTNFNGMDTFTYVVCDNGTPLPVLCDTAQVIITILPVNDAPIAVNDIDTTNEDTSVTLQVVLTNDTDVESVLNTNIDLNLNVLGVQNNFTTPNGVYVNDGNGNVTFTPNPNWNGTDSTPYVVCDNGTPLPVLCDTAMIIIVVLPINDAPTAINDVATTPEDVMVPINVVGNDNDDIDPLGNIDPTTVTIVTAPLNGTTNVLPTGVVEYTPNLNYNGVDSFQYAVCDDGYPLPALCDTAWAVITITPVQDAPYITDDVAVTNEDTAVIINVLVNDNDTIDGSPINPLSVDTVTNPSNGVIVINPNGTITYIPNPNFNGVDSFEYIACDSGIPLPALCDTATVVIIVNPINDQPVAVNDLDTVFEDGSVGIDVVANDSDPLDPLGNIDPTTVTVITNPINGVVTNVDSVTGVVTYEPNTNYNGIDSFQYVVCDDGHPLPALCDTAWAVIVVLPVNDQPVAVNDTTQTVQQTPVIIVVMDNDSDIDTTLNPNTVVSVTTPMNGTVTVNGDGTLTYTPEDGFFGMDEFDYVVCDNGIPLPELCDTATVYITILQDSDEDGIPNDPNPWFQDDIDDDNDGITDFNEGTGDTDGDGVADYLDLDSDGDGIPDNVEAQTTAGYIAPLYNLDGSIVDEDGDGLNDAYDQSQTASPTFSVGLVAVDTDGDEMPDYVDTDSDNDSVLDAIEGNDANHDGVADIVPSGSDDDNDGLDNAFDSTPNGGYFDPNGILVSTNPGNDLPDTDGTEDVDYRDTDDDGDNVPTIVEVGIYEDCDNDGIPNYLDTDVCTPIIPEGISPNGDGLNDTWVIEGLEYFPDHKVWIFNRWGNKVFEAEGYKNDWRGTNTFDVAIANENLPEGTYFYIFETGIEGQAPLKGFIYLTR